MMDAGTKCKIGPFCGLDRGNLQWLVVLDLYSKPSHFDPIVIVE